MDEVVVSSKSCHDCASQMPETAAFCPGCGSSMSTPDRAESKVGIFSENIAGALAYFSFIPAAIFLFFNPYRSNQFVRFHSLQCLFCWLVGVLLAATLRLLALAFFWVPTVGPLLLVLIGGVLALAAFLLWIVLIVKALQGEILQLPWIGDWAEQRADINH